MRIIQLRAENIKRLVAVEITPDGNVIQISGKNGAGKTSVLDAIWWALAGGDAIQKQPVRDGQDRARILLDMGEIVVERNFTQKGSYLRVTNADGMQFSSPQKVLDKMIGKLSFDPLEFIRMKPAEQLEMVQSLAGVDGTEVKLLNRNDYDLRRDVNRDAKQARARADAIEISADVTVEKMDLTKMRAELQGATQVNAEIKSAKAKMVDTIGRIDNARAAIERLEVELEKLKETIADLGEPHDLTDLNEKYAFADIGNDNFDLAERKNEHLEEAKELEGEAVRLTDGMANRTSVFQAAVAAAELPVKGLSISLEDGVTFDGLPLAQASNAEQIRISTALAMSLNPTVRVLRIREGSLLDSNSLQLISGMADDADYQIWIETVDDTGTVGIMLENGMVANREAAE